MNSLQSNPAFIAYAIACLILSTNLIFLWAFSGATRGKTKTAINPEDAAKFGGTLVESDPPEVARVLRAHTNAQANIYPFLFLGLVFVLAGGSACVAQIIFSIFVAARLAHTFVYLKGKQPWRSIFFIIGGLATIGLMLDIIWLLIRG
ncbi:MAPEG family protein [Stenotrophobium rhamnosiphilum]|nr:MAPEG family protein [Stenotrophobium rhamnosiphilum]